jgi:hypothetical protein
MAFVLRRFTSAGVLTQMCSACYIIGIFCGPRPQFAPPKIAPNTENRDNAALERSLFFSNTIGFGLVNVTVRDR